MGDEVSPIYISLINYPDKILLYIMDDHDNLVWKSIIGDKRIESQLLTPSSDEFVNMVLTAHKNLIQENVEKFVELYHQKPELFTLNRATTMWEPSFPIVMEDLLYWQEFIEKVAKKIKKTITGKGYKTVKHKRYKLSPKLENFTKMEIMGRGSFSTVYLVKNQFDDRTYVMKEIRKREAVKIAGEMGNIEREIKVLMKLVKECPNSAYFPCYVDNFEDSEFIYIITEHVGEYENFQRFLNEKSGTLTRGDIKIIMLNLIRGLQILHENGIVHKDIKPDNILINPKTLDIQYIDFGLSCFSTEKMCLNRAKGTPVFIPPEIYHKITNKITDPIYTFDQIKQSDIWALGLVFFEMLVGHSPFEGMKSLIDLKKYMNSLYYNKAKILVDSFITNNLFRIIVSNMLNNNLVERGPLKKLEKLLIE